MPDARCTRSRVRSKKAHALATTGTPHSTGIPCAMVLTVSSALSPVTMLGCHRHPQDAGSVFTNLAPASERQDHAASPSAKALFVRARTAHSTLRPPQFRSAFVTIAIRPSGERNGRMKPLIWGDQKAEYFSRQDWTTQIALN
jgi:hypothetical protein